MIRLAMVAVVAAAAVGCGGAGSFYRTHRVAPTAVEVSHLQSNDPDRVVCRSERQTGSHLYRTLCRYQRDIDLEMAETQARISYRRYGNGRGHH